MSTFLDILVAIASLLPSSILPGLIVEYSDQLQPFYDVLGYVNYFIPFGILLNIFAGWGLFMLVTLIIYHFYKKL